MSDNKTNATQPGDALLPCPFCGYKAADLSDGEYITCQGCGATGATADPHHPQTAAEAWNQRDPNQQGYVDAFYEMAGMLGIGAMPCSPAEAYRDHIKPRLASLLALTQQPPAEGREAVAWQARYEPRLPDGSHADWKWCSKERHEEIQRNPHLPYSSRPVYATPPRTAAVDEEAVDRFIQVFDASRDGDDTMRDSIRNGLQSALAVPASATTNSNEIGSKLVDAPASASEPAQGDALRADYPNMAHTLRRLASRRLLQKTEAQQLLDAANMLVTLGQAFDALASPPQGAETAGDESLWCLHIEGPDDLAPAPSRELAQQAADLFNATFPKSDDPNWPRMHAKVIEWPHGRTEHALASLHFIDKWITPANIRGSAAAPARQEDRS